MSDRTFGVEIEHHIPTLGFAQTRDLYRAKWRDEKFPAEWFGGRTFGHDGSGVELRTPVLRGKEGFKQLEYTFAVANEAGAVVNEFDGMHVHFGAADLNRDEDAQARLVQSWADNENIIYHLVDSARRDHGACPRIWSRPFRTMVSYDWGRRASHIQTEKGETYAKAVAAKKIRAAGAGRGDLNMGPLSRGHIEIRLHEGCLDFNTARAWIEFGQYFIDSIMKRKRPIASCPDAVTFMRRIRVPGESRKMLIARYEHETKPTTPRKRGPKWPDAYYRELERARARG